VRKHYVARIGLVAAMIFGGLAISFSGAEAAPNSLKNLSGDTAVSSDGSVIAPNPGTETANGWDSNTGTDPSPETAESIIGADQRVQIVGTTSYPARAIGMISRNGSQWCTGWLISKDTILTAGHCVNSGGNGTTNGAWYGGLRFSAGRNGPSAPYGYCGVRSTTSFVGWVRDGSEEHDAAVVKLNCSIGTRVGWFGQWWQTASLNGLFTRVQGYPGDKPQTQWLSTGSVTASTTFQIFYQNDTVGGMSGSPIWQNRANGSSFCSGVCGYGIHAYGLHGGAPHSNNNHGTRHTQNKFNVYQSVATAP
jgi:glutamyl endopeptidase